MSGSAIGQEKYFRDGGNYKSWGEFTPATRSSLVSTMLNRNLEDRTFVPVPHRGLHGVKWIQHNSQNSKSLPASYYPDVPENSTASVEAARNLYAMVELDVRLSSNGTPYLLHDMTIGRTVAKPSTVAVLDGKTVKPFIQVPQSACDGISNCIEWNLVRSHSLISNFLDRGKNHHVLRLKTEKSGAVTDYKLPKLVDIIKREVKKGNMILLLDIQDEPTFNASLNALHYAVKYFKERQNKGEDVYNPLSFVVFKVFTNKISIKDMQDARAWGTKPLLMPVIQSRDFISNASKRTPIKLVQDLENLHKDKKINMLGVQLSWWGNELFKREYPWGYQGYKWVSTRYWGNLINKVKDLGIPLAAYHNAPNKLDYTKTKLTNRFKFGYYYKGETGKGSFQKTKPINSKTGVRVISDNNFYNLMDRYNNSWDISKYVRTNFNILISDTPGLIFANQDDVPTDYKLAKPQLPNVYGFNKRSTMSMNSVMNSVMNIESSPQIDLSSVDSTSVSTTSEESVFEVGYSRPFPCSMNQLVGTATKIAANNNDIAMIGINGKVNLWDDINKNWQDINIANQKELAIGGGTIWAINNNNRLYTIYPDRDSIADMNISLKKIAVNAFGTAAGIGMDNKIYLYDEVEDEWSNLGGGASQIVVDALGNPWHIGANNGIWRWDVDTNNWIKLTGSGKALATNDEGDVFLIGMNGKIHRWNDETENWDMTNIVQTDFVQIAALSDNLLVGMKANGSVFKSECAINYGEFQKPATMTCTRLLGNKKAFKVVTDGQQAAVIETNKDLWLYDNKTWRKLAQNAIDVAIDHDGSLWYIGTDNKIYTQNTSDDTWTVVLGMAKKISIGGSDENRKVVIIGEDNAIYEFDFENNTFEKMEGTFATEIAVDSYGKIWHLGTNNYIYNQTEEGWRIVANGKGVKISTSSDGVVAVIGMDGNLYSYEGGITDLWKKITLNGFVANDFKEFQVSNDLVILGIKNNNDLVGVTKDCNTPLLDNYSGDYIIQNVATGKVLDVSQASVNSGAKIIQYQDNNASNQRFKISVNANGYTISPIHAPSKYLNVCDCENSNNDPITIQSKKWDIERFNINPLQYDQNGNLIASINSDFSGLDLGVHNASQSSVMQWDVTWGVENDKRFQWRFIKVNSSNPTTARIAENQVNPKDSLSVETIENELIKELSEVKESSESGLIVYPNPTASEINIEVNDFADTEDLNLFFIDSMGKIILQKNIGKSRKLKLDAQELLLSNQIYIIVISNGDKKLTKKLIISNKP